MRYFTQEIQTVLEAEIRQGVAPFDKSQIQLKITYIDDPQPVAWAFAVYRADEDTIEVMIASRESKNVESI